MNHQHLAQINISKMKFSIDSPKMQGFILNLDRINALADAQPGFVWRLKGETNNATEIQVFDDTQFIINMSVWTSVETLKEYVFRTAHVEIMRQRRQWFKLMDEANYVLWWIPAGHIPTLQEAKEKLEYLRKNGPSAEAFDFKYCEQSAGE
ncbi:MAG: hypothetical protein DHS20C18_46270 [Saprospiraceae bacterium]|nr:MAG: hypothetical protein DHS20C18_46270 [Saprospiraceae bacterium]